MLFLLYDEFLMRETLNFRYLRKIKTHSRCICICHQESSKGNLRDRRQETKCILALPLTKPHTGRAISITPILLSPPFCRGGRLRGRVVRLVGQDHKAKLEQS